MFLTGTFKTHQRSQLDCTAIRNSIVVPPVALLPLAVVVLPVAIVVPPVTLLPLAVAVPPVVVPSTMRGREGAATSGR